MARHSVVEAACQWREVEPDIRIGRLSRLGLDCGTLVHLVANWLSGIRLYVTEACLAKVCMHVGSSSREVGGLLIGRAFAVSGPDQPVVVLERALESLEYRSSAVSLEMGAEVWGRARAEFDEGRWIVGWYHSHPDQGAFFSGTDRSTQRAFFGHPYSIGWVIDPDRVEQKVFEGQDSTEYPIPLVVLDHEPALGCRPSRRIDAGIGYDRKAVLDSINRGEPLALNPKTRPFARGLFELVTKVRELAVTAREQDPESERG